ncbi:uncharacterized protein LAESUDRAFT_664777, partial [Laetiporus sulphureus 93-53]
GEEEHRTVKTDYNRTNKNNATGQIARRQHHKMALHRIQRSDDRLSHEKKKKLLRAKKKVNCDKEWNSSDSRNKGSSLGTAVLRGATLDFAVDEPLPFTSPEAHFHISDSQRYSEDITSWLQSNRNDPACAVSISSVMGSKC